MRLKYLFAAALIGLLPACANAKGTLMIVGGALQADNEPVYRAFIDAIPADGPQKIAIVGVASGSPVQSATSFKEDLVAYGVDPSRIFISKLAMKDDRSTQDVDESDWAENADNAEEVAKLAEAGAVWFTGGDQLRIGQALITPEGKDTPMLVLLRQRLQDGAVIGGTSAGAAMMSHVMIIDGDSLPALLYGIDQDGDKPGGALKLSLGPGFLPFGIVDQHFDARARLGRLIRALTRLPQDKRIGLGIDENTAFVVDLESTEVQVVGAATLTFIDARDASFTDGEDGLAVTGMRLHVLSSGDRMTLASGETAIADYKSDTVDNEYFDSRSLSGGGMALAYQDIPQTVGSELLDNAKADSIDRYSFLNSGQGVVYRFRQAKDSAGYYGQDANRKGQYSALNVGFDILPIQVEIEELAP